MLRYSHVIWDYNGTIVDDADLCIEIMNENLRDLSMPTIARNDYLDTFTMPIEDYYARLGFDFTKRPYKEVAAHFIRNYAERRFDLPLHQGVREALAAITAAGGHNHVLSAYNHKALTEMITHHGIAGYFENLQGIGDHYASGKLAEGKRLFETIGAPAADIVMIGDTDHDAAVAKALGIDCILVAGGHMSENRLQKCGVPVAASIPEAAALLFSA